MILMIEPISINIGVYVPAYPLPILEIASYVKSKLPEIDIGIISIPVDYGLPLNTDGKNHIYKELLNELSDINLKGIGISCTAIFQAEEAIHLCETIKKQNPDIFIFMGGYFPTLYYEEIFEKTSAVDLVVIGEGEVSTLKIVEDLEKDKNPINQNTPNLAWKEEGEIKFTPRGKRFDLKEKAPLNLGLLRHPRSYDVLPYSFSRGCPYKCNFCMEDYIRPVRKAVPSEIIKRDLTNLANQTSSRSLLVSDALFKSFDQLHLIRSLDMKIQFETRCDVLDSAIIPELADVCGLMALGFESASYNTLKRMNKVKDKVHFKRYISNTISIFNEAVKNDLPLIVFMIAGYPGDTEEDLEASLDFVREISKDAGSGGYVFKIGECRVYPKTKIYDLAHSLPDVIFDDDTVFGQNIVKQPSKGLGFNTVLDYMEEIYGLSHNTQKLQKAISNTMPFFRLPTQSLMDNLIPDSCYGGENRNIFNVKSDSLLIYRELVPNLMEKYKSWMSREREVRNLNI